MWDEVEHLKTGINSEVTFSPMEFADAWDTEVTCFPNKKENSSP